MKNFIVASMLGHRDKSKQQQQHQQTQDCAKMPLDLLMTRRSSSGRRSNVQQQQRPRGKSCDRMMSHHKSEQQQQRNNNLINDDGGFSQWRSLTVIHQAASAVPATVRPDVAIAEPLRRSRPCISSDRAQLVLQQPNDPFNYSLPAGMYFQPQQLMPPQQATAVSSWAHHNVLRYQVQQQQQQQQDIGGPQSLDSQWILHQKQAEIAIRTDDHPAALTRKLSTYGTLPRNRQRRFFFSQSKSITIHATSNRQEYRDKIHICRRSSIHLRLSYCILFPTAVIFFSFLYRTLDCMHLLSLQFPLEMTDCKQLLLFLAQPLMTPQKFINSVIIMFAFLPGISLRISNSYYSTENYVVLFSLYYYFISTIDHQNVK